MVKSPRRVWKASTTPERERPWAIVLAGGWAVGLRRGLCPEIVRPIRRGQRTEERAAERGNFQAELLERYRGGQWH